MSERDRIADARFLIEQYANMVSWGLTERSILFSSWALCVSVAALIAALNPRLVSFHKNAYLFLIVAAAVSLAICYVFGYRPANKLRKILCLLVGHLSLEGSLPPMTLNYLWKVDPDELKQKLYEVVVMLHEHEKRGKEMP
jgi:FtsH-binding integral membrane protein